MKKNDQDIRQSIMIMFLLPVGLLVFGLGALHAGYLMLSSFSLFTSGFFAGFLSLAFFSMGVKTND